MKTMLNLPKAATRRQEWIEGLYREVFPGFARLVARQGGTLEDARELFQEGLLIYYEKHGQTPLKNEKGYLFGICKNLFRRSHREAKIFESTDPPEMAEEKEMQVSTTRLLKFLQVAGERCLELLQTCYYEQATMGELAARFGFKSERSATVQKYKCLEKVREEVKSRSMSYEDFID